MGCQTHPQGGERSDVVMKKDMVAVESGAFNVSNYGAVGDGKTVNTKAIQAALDACGKAGGGTVVVPAGCFVTGTIWLRSHVELHLSQGAVLKASPDLADYNKLDAYAQNFMAREEEWNGGHLILGIEIEDVSLTGPGTIDGNGKVFYAEPKPYHHSSWRDGLALSKDKENLRPGQLIVFCESRNIRVRDLTIRDATCWCVFLHGCEDVLVRGLKVNNASTAANTDGIDVDCCRNVTISDCIIDTGDDAITLRGDNAPLKDKTRVCENIVVNNCVVASSSSVFRIGVGNGVIRNAVFSNIIINRGGVAFTFQSAYWPGPGVTISNITIRDVVARNLSAPFSISPGQPEATAQIRDIVINGLSAEVFNRGTIYGNAHSRPRNIQLRNIDLKIVPHPGQFGPPRQKPPETALAFRAADDITLENVRVEWRTAEPGWQKAMSSEDVTGLKVGEDCRLPEPGRHE
jgi:polygalacturonase